jgi:HEAT repeat protein
VNSEKELERLKQEAKADPENPQVLIQIAQAYERLEQWRGAIQYWNKASSLSRQVSPELYQELKRWKKVKQLLEDLESPDLVLRRSAIDTLGCLKEVRCLYRLVPLLSDPECQWNVSQAIRSIHSSASAPYLLALLDHPQHRVRAEAIRLLVFLNTSSEVPLMLKCLQDEHFTVVKEALLALGLWGDSQVVSLLLPFLKSSNLSLKHACIEALGQLKAEEALPELLSIFRNLSSASRLFALKAIQEIGKKEERHFLRDLNDPEFEIRDQISKILAKSPDPEVFDSLCRLLKHPQKELRFMAIQTLTLMENPLAVSALQELLKTEKTPLLVSKIKGGILRLIESSSFYESQKEE